ncbi:hypothetical protein JZ751_000844 [Albula glossodonta]|uniref:Proteasome activator complex subunit 1 n=1 Tax=Albula glossodonta TaxID=121402 RepID=A0A8T2PXC5_9TELE|nr:hypothetical protein JZ751_000844 [Albula glossodonta]
MTSMDICLESKKQVDDFCKQLTKEVNMSLGSVIHHAESLVKTFFPQKIEEMDRLLQVRGWGEEEGDASLCVEDLSSLRAPLDIPIPDPAKEELKRKKKEEVSMWVQLQVPRIEDGNNFGVAVQVRTVDVPCLIQYTCHTPERSSNTCCFALSYSSVLGDYRQLVHELDEHQYCELRVVVLEIRNTYVSLDPLPPFIILSFTYCGFRGGGIAGVQSKADSWVDCVRTLYEASPPHQTAACSVFRHRYQDTAVLYDIISKNYDKIKRPRGDCKALIY